MARPLALPPGWNSAAGHRHEARRNEVEAHGQSRHGKHLSRVADAACGTLWVVVWVAAHERHQTDAGLETREPQGELREHEQRHPNHHQGIAVAGKQRILPVAYHLRIGHYGVDADGYYDEVEQEIGDDHEYCDSDRLPKAPEEDRAK